MTERPSFEVLLADRRGERDRWIQAWERWPAHEVYAHPSYVELFAGQDGSAAAAVCQVDGTTVLYPFVIRSIRRERFWVPDCGDCVDITSPYGYGGAYRWGGGEPRPDEVFWRMFDEWASNAGVVSEFVRFDLHPERLASYPGTVESRLMNVIRSLDTPPEELLADVAHKVRKNVKRARASGIRVLLDEDGNRLEDFERIYLSTMVRREADSRYLFSLDWLQRLVAALPGQFAFFHAVKGDIVVSSELVLVSADFVYSFLGGTDSSAFADRPNDLLKYEVMLWARERGKQAFVLGGGYEPGDGIFKYKESFAPRGVVPFSTGSRVLDREKYSALARRAAEIRGPDAADAAFFPEYRA